MTGAFDPGRELYAGQTADFVSEARRALAWLEDRGFGLGEVLSAFVEWQSEEVSVLVSLRQGPDGAYCRVQLALGPSGEPGLEGYLSMYLLEELRPPPDDAPFRPLGRARLDACDREEMRASLARIGELLRTQVAEPRVCGGEGLRALKQESRRRIREAADRVRSDDLRSEAKQAFDARDYARTVMLYESAGGELRPAERKRLDIARRRLAPAERRLDPSADSASRRRRARAASAFKQWRSARAWPRLRAEPRVRTHSPGGTLLTGCSTRTTSIALPLSPASLGDPLRRRASAFRPGATRTPFARWVLGPRERNAPAASARAAPITREQQFRAAARVASANGFFGGQR